MPPAVGAAILAAFGAATWTALTIQVLVYSAASFALTKVINALAPRRKTGETRGMEASVTDSAADGRVLYGEVRTSGINVIPPWTNGDSNRYLHQVLAVAVHEVDSFSDVYFDQETIGNAAIGTVTGTNNDGKVASGKYNNAAWIRRYTGTAAQTVDFILNAAFPSTWTADARGRGITYVALRYDYGDGKTYTGIPQITFKVRGKKCYDPRLDTAPGANPTNAAYAAWTDNPALCWADYKTALYGRNVPAADIDWPAVVTAADDCDELVAVPTAATQKRYTCNGILLANNDPNDNERKLLDAMMGRMVYIRGKWTVYSGSWSTASANIDKGDWSSLGAIQTTAARDGGRYNGVRVYHVDPERNWQRVESYPRFSDTYRTADNNERIWLEMEQPMCTDAYEAQRKAEILLRLSRNGVRITGTLPPRFMLLTPWDVVALNFDELGWVSKTFRIITTVPNPDGSIEVSMVEEQSADWDDMTEGEYGNPSVAAMPPANPTTPSEPRNFVVSSQPVLLKFDWDDPAVKPEGTRYRLLAGASSYTDPSSRRVIYDGLVSDALHQTFDTTTPQYYQVQAYANSYFGPTMPNTFGVAAVPLRGGVDQRTREFYRVSTGTIPSRASTNTAATLALGGLISRGGEIRVQYAYDIVSSCAVTWDDVSSWLSVTSSGRFIGPNENSTHLRLRRRVNSGSWLFVGDPYPNSPGDYGYAVPVYWGLRNYYPGSAAANRDMSFYIQGGRPPSDARDTARQPTIFEYVQKDTVTSAFYEYELQPIDPGDNSLKNLAGIAIADESPTIGFAGPLARISSFSFISSNAWYPPLISIAQVEETLLGSILETLGAPSDAPLDSAEYVRKNGAWVAAASSGAGIADAPSDSVPYLRRNAAWVNANSYITGIGSGFADVSSDGNFYARRNNAWSNINSLSDAAPKAVGSGSLFAFYNGSWTNITSLSSAVPDAVGSGTLYGRLNNSWTNINSLRDAVPDVASNGQVMARLNNTWAPVASHFLPTSWDASSNGELMARLNNTWARVDSYFLTDAASDGKIYGRLNADWYDISSFALSDAPLNSRYYLRYNAQWVDIGSATDTTSAGVTRTTDAFVWNAGSETITRGMVLAVSSPTPGIPFQSGVDFLPVRPASALDERLSDVIGIALQDIVVGASGAVRKAGSVVGLPNSVIPFFYGQRVWVGNTPGTLVSSRPLSPSRSVPVGVVLDETGGATSGHLFVDLYNGNDFLHNTNVTSAPDGSLLSYSTSGGMWTPRNLALADLPMQTARLLGRTSANTGGVETITVGTGLQLSGSTLSATGGGGGGGGGTSRVLTQSLDLGSQAGAQGVFTYTEVSNICARGLTSRILIGIAGTIQPLFDVEVRNAGSSSGDLFLRANGITDARYDASIPFYYENDASQSVFIGIRNRAAQTASFNLNLLRVEKFA